MLATSAIAFIATTMLSIHCPAEVWLEILSHLPRTTLLSTCMLSKYFLDLSLDLLYEEITLDSSDKMARERLQMVIRDKNVADRVRRLTILPPLSEGRSNPTSSSRQIRFLNYLCHLEDLRRNFAGLSCFPSQQIECHLNVSTSGLPICLTNVQEVTITLSSFYQNQNFCNFYKYMWEKNCIGPNIRKFSVSTPALDLAFLIMPMLRYGSAILKNLTHVRLDLGRSYNPTKGNKNQVWGSLTKLVNLAGSSLTSLSFSSSDPNIDRGANLSSLPFLQSLQKLEYHCPFYVSSLADMTALTEFIGKYSTQLSHLVIAPFSTRVWDEDDGHPAGESYSKWITSTDSRGIDLSPQIGLSSLVLPALRYLAIRPAGRMSRRNILPDLRQFAPGLKSLRISGPLPQALIYSILNFLSSDSDGGYQLEKLAIQVKNLSPDLFDNLYTKLPHLKHLEIKFSALSSSNSEGPEGGILRTDGVPESTTPRKYAHWSLQYLRIAPMAECQGRHPDMALMKTVGNWISDDIILDAEKRCQCDDKLGC
ncbi:hypothetical protein NLJ89_g2667 [Agrocybe chaxingu]|uniref:F-box domain-containing protein n=1 Tax=Agrocybe chaxingu TaxID=84603 RepID=A0A9W8MXH6_9AGAR|nr:hypothetical protein NLJ89_g2667 [Agrocybe chaxingu]